MRIFVLTRERGPRWDGSRGLREQDAWDEHAAFMEALADEGFIFLGGPLGEDRVMHVVVAGSWAADKKGKVTLTPFAPLPRSARRDVEDEAARLEAWLR